MAGLTKNTTTVTNIADLSSTPNATEGLTAAQLQAKFDKAAADIKTYINDTLTVELDARHPIGSIYMSVANTNPGTFLPGTWTAWGTGRVPVGIDTGDANFNTVEKEVGASTVTLDTTMIPSHKHTSAWSYSSTGTSLAGTVLINSAGKVDFTRDTSDVGGGLAHNNIQKSITCYMFKRTA